jgi:tRNA pseudouridine32 synthase/23S rRNA pseudouridine746 synthase
MLGVVVVREHSEDSARQSLGYLAAFSGNVGGRSMIEGFVPPIYDLMDPDGEFKRREADITEINKTIQDISSSDELVSLKAELTEAERDRDTAIEAARATMALSKARREKIRQDSSDASVLSELVKESQFEKAEFKRLKSAWEEKVTAIRKQLADIVRTVDELKSKRASMSEELQEWIFRQYIVHNSLGCQSSISEIFSGIGLIPPGGTGECAAPKLLEFAYRNGLEPLAMGEFWYGQSPLTAVRTHGHFYPSCTSKCGPLLGYMLKGIGLSTYDGVHGEPSIIYEDSDLIAVSKPSGMPSVPGLDGKLSLLDLLSSSAGPVQAVHRLDMDTSGIIIYAKTRESEVNLKKQFEEHTIRKTYMARLCPADSNRFAGKVRELKAGDKDTIELPLGPDYDERPRQKVDRSQGKEALTEYEVVSVNEDGTTDILFHPHTGRTHQLRVHSAHIMGLGRPILGDLLYGGCQNACSYSSEGQAAPGPAIPEQMAERLHLHASSITFRHPSTSETLTIDTCENSYI